VNTLVKISNLTSFFTLDIFIANLGKWFRLSETFEKGGSKMHVSKLSAKGQVTIPIEIRKAMGIEPGDLVAYKLQGQCIKLKRITPFDAVFHSAVSETLEEWSSPDDEEAFNDL
jgi:antitoxin PrlF